MRRGIGASKPSSLGFERVVDDAAPQTEARQASSSAVTKPHLVEPLPLLEWKGTPFFGQSYHINLTIIFFMHSLRVLWDSWVAGKQGIGVGKRACSPEAEERLAKIAKLAEKADQRDFRERARDDYNNRRAEGRLGAFFLPP